MTRNGDGEERRKMEFLRECGEKTFRWRIGVLLTLTGLVFSGFTYMITDRIRLEGRQMAVEQIALSNARTNVNLAAAVDDIQKTLTKLSDVRQDIAAIRVDIVRIDGRIDTLVRQIERHEEGVK